MRINAHSHIFNLKSVFTQETLEILLRRVTGFGIPEFAEKKLVEVLEKAIGQAAEFTEIELLMDKFVKEIAIGEKIKTVAENEKINLEIVGEEIFEKAGAHMLSRLMGKLLDNLDPAAADARKQNSLMDMLGFLVIGLKPSIAAVTSHLIDQIDENDAIVALMMDITHGGDADRELFENQISQTSEQVLRYPGRILPFIAVNPLRNGYLSIMEHALISRGFVGVKLYPSLGYDIDSNKLDPVYAYCHQRNIPLLMHCTQKGFYADEQYIPNSEPKLWEPILKKYPGLKICFGHFGSDDYLDTDIIPPDSWTGQIIDLMKVPENKGVFADISFHTDPMKGGDEEENYFKNLKDLIQDPVVGHRILFGTDFWLVRMAVREKNYWQYYEKKLNDTDIFKKIAHDNPMQFLGISEIPGQCRDNINNHIRFIAGNLENINPMSAARWIVDEVNAAGHQVNWSRALPGSKWSPNNEAHARVFRYLMANQMYPDDVKKLEFPDCAFFPVTSLQYWNKEFEAASIFLKKCEAVAKGMDRYFIKNKAVYEADTSRNQAISALINALADEGTVLSDLGRLSDKHYEFSWER